MEVEASVARCLRTPPAAAKRQDFDFGISSRVTQPEQPEHSCRLQLSFWPDNGGTMPSERTPFTPSSILFRPHQMPLPVTLPSAALGGGAGYRPRVRMVYYDSHLSP